MEKPGLLPHRAPSHREAENVLCVCVVCVILSLSMCSGTRADRQASWCACALRRRDLSSCVCVCSLPRSQQTSLLSSPRPGFVSPVCRHLACGCVFLRRSFLSLGGGVSACVCVCSPPSSTFHLSASADVCVLDAHASFFAEDAPSPPLSLVAARGS